MKKSDFEFDLPEELIAQHPSAERSASRLLYLKNGETAHHIFRDIIDFIHPEDLMVFNNTRVIPARLFARKETGGKVEILIERIRSSYNAAAHVKASKTPQSGQSLYINDIEIIIDGREGDLFLLSSKIKWADILNAHGHMPLPPYIERSDEDVDQDRYQTVYARHDGSVAAPTAGLHFDDALLQQLKDKGVRFANVTLHVGAGTFQPVRTDNILEHKMHSEYIEVPLQTIEAIEQTRANGGRVIAVGTTSVRALETAKLKPYCGESEIFIYPGYAFTSVDAMITNFHLPGSTLLMLVSAFSGLENIKQAYQTAIAEKYRFFSYGDAMFLTKGD